MYRPSEDSYTTRDLVFRPDVDTSAYQPVLREPSGRRVSFSEIAPYPVGRTPFERGPGSGGGIVEDRPSDPGIDERPRSGYEPAFGQDFMNKMSQAERTAKAFLDMYLLGGGMPSEVAGYRPFIPVAPGDIDSGGPESPEAMARFADYLRQRRERGDFERARQRLMQQGFPLGGV